MNKKHKARTMAASLIRELIDSIFESDACLGSNFEDDEVVSLVQEDKEVSGTESKREEAGKISEYERIRNARVAAIRAEFMKFCPTFEEDVLALKVKKPCIKRRRKTGATKPSVVRKSGRIQGKGDTACFVIENDEDDVNRVDVEVMSCGDGDSGVKGTEVTFEKGEKAADIADEAVGSGCVAELTENIVVCDPADEDVDGDSAHLGRFGCPPCGMKFRYVVRVY